MTMIASQRCPRWCGCVIWRPRCKATKGSRSQITEPSSHNSVWPEDLKHEHTDCNRKQYPLRRKDSILGTLLVSRELSRPCVKIGRRHSDACVGLCWPAMQARTGFGASRGPCSGSGISKKLILLPWSPFCPRFTRSFWPSATFPLPFPDMPALTTRDLPNCDPCGWKGVTWKPWSDSTKDVQSGWPPSLVLVACCQP